MIAIFTTLEAAQAYCDARSKTLGYPITGTHPRTGATYVVTAAWDAPVKHPKLDLWRVNVDRKGPVPDAELVDQTPADWDRYSPFIGAVRATHEEALELARTETDQVAMSVILEKITPEEAATIAHDDPDMQMALIQKEHEVYLWLKNRKS